MTDLEKIIAEHADVTTDERGRKSYEFDDHGLRAFLAALAGAEPDQPVGELDRSAPERVWLQIDTDGDPEDRSEVIRRENWSDLTWCYESIGGQEVVYIRADLAHSPAKAREDEMDERDAAELLRLRYAMGERLKLAALNDKVLALAAKWDRIADEHGVRQFTGNDHRLFANELRAALATFAEGE